MLKFNTQVSKHDACKQSHIIIAVLAHQFLYLRVTIDKIAVYQAIKIDTSTHLDPCRKCGIEIFELTTLFLQECCIEGTTAKVIDQQYLSVAHSMPARIVQCRSHRLL